MRKNFTKYAPYLLFIVGFILFAFTRAVTYVPIAIVIAPICILGFSRSKNRLTAILLVLLGFAIALTISLWGLYSFENKGFSLIFNTIRSLLLAIVLALPYIADRLISHKIQGFISTLIFPTYAAAIYFLDSTFGPFDGTGIFFAYTQYGNLPFLQLMSVFGIWGQVFFLSWFASMANWAWEKQFQWDEIKKGIALYSCAAIIILAFGGLRISPLFDQIGKTVKVAAIVWPDEKQNASPSIEQILKGRIYSSFNSTIEKIKRQAGKAAQLDSKIVAFQEFAIVLDKKDEIKFQSEMRKTAQDNKIYLNIGYAVYPESKNEKGENRSILINPTGKIEADYLKHNLAVGEGMFMKKGPGNIPVVSTPYGRIGITICRDSEFPPYMRQAGKKGADIVLAPSYDFPKTISPSNTYNQMLRSVEYGFSVIRPTHNGLSVAVDYHGRILSSMDYFTTSDGIMLADVPTRGIRTVYGLIGDLFAWVCIIGALCFILLSIYNTKSRNTQ